MQSRLEQTLRKWLTPRGEGAGTPESAATTVETTGSQPQPDPSQVYGMIRLFRKIGVLIVGLTVVLIGIIMIVTPGPAVVVIPLGLGILATEFLWAQRILNLLRKKLLQSYEQLGGKKAATSPPDVNPRPRS